MFAPVTAKARPTRLAELESVKVIVKVPGDAARAHQHDNFWEVVEFVIGPRKFQVRPLDEMPSVPVFVAYSQA